MPLSRRAYLSKTGAIELLCEINPAGSRFQELLDELSISRPTLAKRLAEGRELEFIDQKAISGERGTTHVHTLTPKGATVRVRLFEENVVITYNQYKNARKQFEKHREKFRESLESELPDLGDSERNEANLEMVRQRSGITGLEEE